MRLSRLSAMSFACFNVAFSGADQTTKGRFCLAGQLAKSHPLHLRPLLAMWNAKEPPMSSRAHTQTSMERRVRRLGRPFNVSLLVAQKLNPKIEAHGGYMLRDDDTKQIVFGNAGYEFSADLDEVEAFLTESREAMHAERKKKK
jgi:hypothetical protein